MRIAAVDGLADEGVRLLEGQGHEVVIHLPEGMDLGDALAGFDAVIVRSATQLDEQTIRRAGQGHLRAIGRAGVGVDNIDVTAATHMGIPVVNAPAASTNSVVELALGHLLSSARRIPEADRSLRGGAWEKARFKGFELRGKRLGLLGFGRIARGVAQGALALGMEVGFHDPYLPDTAQFPSDVDRFDTFDSMVRVSTHLSVHCNLTEETRHVIDEDVMRSMAEVGPDGVHCGRHLINCARGGIVDEMAALDALKQGVLSTCSLDVFEVEPVDAAHPLLKHPRFQGTPHIGASTLEAQRRVGMDIASAIMEALDGTLPTSTINRADLSV